MSNGNDGHECRIVEFGYNNYSGCVACLEDKIYKLSSENSILKKELDEIKAKLDDAIEALTPFAHGDHARRGDGGICNMCGCNYPCDWAYAKEILQKIRGEKQ